MFLLLGSIPGSISFFRAGTDCLGDASTFLAAVEPFLLAAEVADSCFFMVFELVLTFDTTFCF